MITARSAFTPATRSNPDLPRQNIARLFGLTRQLLGPLKPRLPGYEQRRNGTLVTQSRVPIVQGPKQEAWFEAHARIARFP
jgi:hypothetical protein